MENNEKKEFLSHLKYIISNYQTNIPNLYSKLTTLGLSAISYNDNYFIKYIFVLSSILSLDEIIYIIDNYFRKGDIIKNMSTY